MLQDVNFIVSIAWGMIIGAAIGTATHNMAPWVASGAVVGAVLGAVLRRVGVGPGRPFRVGPRLMWFSFGFAAGTLIPALGVVLLLLLVLHR